MKIENLQPGQVVYDVHSHRMGNTTMRTVGTWQVRIKEVDIEGQKVLASWNTNPEQWYYAQTWSKWRKEKPALVKMAFGGYRMPNRAEIAPAKRTAKRSKP